MRTLYRLWIWLSRCFGPYRCPSCGANDGHSALCFCATRGQLLAGMRMWKRDSDGKQRGIDFWHGYARRCERERDAIVHENNQLRKARYPGKC